MISDPQIDPRHGNECHTLCILSDNETLRTISALHQLGDKLRIMISPRVSLSLLTEGSPAFHAKDDARKLHATCIVEVNKLCGTVR